mmetsp:Transcript_142647/g.371715  ORF Transcript_142647/g.371715 Transcript_142647/m.371715 type:complete len:698 (+) Transcript_142647:107-2200(+)
MAGQIPSLMKQKGFVFWLMGFTLVYQLVNQVIMWRAVQQDIASSDDCGVGAASSPKCLEFQIFRTWQQAAPVWQNLGEGEGKSGSIVEDMTPAPNATEDVSATLTGPPTDAADGVEPIAAAPFAGEVGQEEDASQSWSPVTDWAQGLVDLQSQLESYTQSLPSIPPKREEDLSQQLDRHAQNIIMSLEASNVTRWGHELEELQESLEIKKAALPSQRLQQPRQLNAEMRSANATDHSDTTLDHIYSAQGVFCKDPEDLMCVTLMALADARKHSQAAEARRQAALAQPVAKNTGIESSQRAATLDVDLAAISAESAAWQHAFEQRAAQAHKDLCEHPQRRDRPDCAKFLESITKLEQQKTEAFQVVRQATKAALRANIAREAKERAATLDVKLSTLVAQREAWETQLVAKYALSQDRSPEGIAGTGMPPAQDEDSQDADNTALTHHHGRELHWSTVVAWSAGRGLRGRADSRSHAKVERAELRAAHWMGIVPKVACITAVRSGPALGIQLKYFIDNFNLQSYEGPTQLVFVYHYKDRAAARLVAGHADGARIKGVAARGKGRFPSTTAFRFGAWASDADVVAHWDFHQFQHPERLSLQVRALAYSSRPASILKGLAGTGASTGASEATLLGERAWMEEHWHPLLKEQKVVLERAQARNVVEVDMGVAGRNSSGDESLMALGESMDESLDDLLQSLHEE